MATAKTAPKKVASKATPKKSVAKKAPVKQKVSDVLLSVVLDRSSSMNSIRDATIDGFNSFLDEQRKLSDDEGGKVRVTLVQFDDRYEVNFVGELLENVPALDRSSYQPRGSTALMDAICHAVADTEKFIKKTKYEGRVLFLIITDGEENVSKEHDIHDVNDVIQRKELKDDWSFAFMGANIDSYAVGHKMGISAGAIHQYVATPQGTNDTWTAASLSTTNYRSSGGSGVTAAAAFFDDPNAGTVVPTNTPKNAAAPVKRPSRKLDTTYRPKPKK